MSTAPFFRLSELSGLVAGVMEQVFSGRAFWVIADVTSHSYKAGKNHHYFDLIEKDPGSSAIIAKFAARAWTEGSEQITAFEQATGQRFTNDINVLVLVSVNYHPAFGLQLVVHDIDTSFTLGTLEKQKQATLLRLVKENADHVRIENDNYITFNQELELPHVLQHIAVISSSTSAGYEDFLHTLQNNKFGYTFKIEPYFTVVQGENNAQYIVEKLIEIYHSGKTYDTVVVIRGGGAQTDLLLFEQYSVGRAIARFPIPIITGIGHQKNETVADLMAHTAVKTPTKAAEFIIAHNRDFFDDMLSMEKSIIIRAQQMVSNHMQALAQINNRLISSVKDLITTQKQELNNQNQFVATQSQKLLYQHRSNLQALSAKVSRRPSLLLYQKQRDIDGMAEKLLLNSKHFIQNQQHSLNNFSTYIRLLSSENVLKKGFAIIKHNEQFVSNGNNIEPGNEIAVIFAKQQLLATVTDKKEHDERDNNL
ncbi:exodeoxyribonuclease VII large subunit [Mucilaginibacter lacusdianchii]|uniref:exodeoxyribonuclease VII large subunit n=1 Tax=Mucilaginibacter lacusdianchii TaxID=2684211 RepID=UPI00131B46CA|nr:exodeoxyribonuclease VII large subunit [Mucilaginibacter sp. JXJ CY 39]